MAKAMTQEEVRDAFLMYIWHMVRYWETVENPHNEDRMQPRDRLEGLAFSILTMLDGNAMNLPAFEIYPAPHPNDMLYHQERGKDWWPELEDQVSVHGGSMLHELWHRFGEEHGFLRRPSVSRWGVQCRSLRYPTEKREP